MGRQGDLTTTTRSAVSSALHRFIISFGYESPALTSELIRYPTIIDSFAMLTPLRVFLVTAVGALHSSARLPLQPHIHLAANQDLRASLHLVLA